MPVNTNRTEQPPIRVRTDPQHYCAACVVGANVRSPFWQNACCLAATARYHRSRQHQVTRGPCWSIPIGQGSPPDVYAPIRNVILPLASSVLTYDVWRRKTRAVWRPVRPSTTAPSYPSATAATRPRTSPVNTSRTGPSRRRVGTSPQHCFAAFVFGANARSPSWRSAYCFNAGSRWDRARLY